MTKKTTGAARPRRPVAGRPSKPVNTDSFHGKLGAAIRERRTGLGLTLEDVALMTGGRLTSSMLGSYEQGAEPGISRYIILCLALGVCLTDLLPPDVAEMIGKRINTDKLNNSIGRVE